MHLCKSHARKISKGSKDQKTGRGGKQINTIAEKLFRKSQIKGKTSKIFFFPKARQEESHWQRKIRSRFRCADVKFRLLRRCTPNYFCAQI